MRVVEPKAPWETVEMSFLVMIGCDFREGKEVDYEEAQKTRVYAGGTASDLVILLVRTDVSDPNE